MSAGDQEKHEPLRLPTWWPGASGTVKFPDDSSMMTVVNALSGHQGELDSAMSVLHAEGLVTADDVGNWDAGEEFAGTAKSAHQHVLAVYREFQRQLEEVVRLLAKSDHSHSAAEAASRRASQRAGAPLDVPNGVPTQQSAPSKD
jgi:precorrin-4 methylase